MPLAIVAKSTARSHPSTTMDRREGGKGDDRKASTVTFAEASRRKREVEYLAMCFFQDASAVATGALIGALTRIALDFASEALVPKSQFPGFLSNTVGSFLMAVITDMKAEVIRFTTPSVYVGMAVGFCGTLTAFSVFIMSGSLLLSVSNLTGLWVLYVSFMAFLTAYLLGQHFVYFVTTLTQFLRGRRRVVSEAASTVLPAVIGAQIEVFESEQTDTDGAKHPVSSNQVFETNKTAEAQKTLACNDGDPYRSGSGMHRPLSFREEQEEKPVVLIVCVLLLLLFYGCLFAAIYGAAVDFLNKKFWWPLVFCPLGAVSRYILSKLNNYWAVLYNRICLGTLLCNVLASLLASISRCYLINNGVQTFVCIVFISVSGSLGTVSTFCNEMYRLPLEWGYLYACLSILICSVMSSLILTYQ